VRQKLKEVAHTAAEFIKNTEVPHYPTPVSPYINRASSKLRYTTQQESFRVIRAIRGSIHGHRTAIGRVPTGVQRGLITGC